jgi:hypothetical protein
VWSTSSGGEGEGKRDGCVVLYTTSEPTKTQPIKTKIVLKYVFCDCESKEKQSPFDSRYHVDAYECVRPAHDQPVESYTSNDDRKTKSQTVACENQKQRKNKHFPENDIPSVDISR